MKRIFASCTLVVLVACGTDSTVTGPETTQQTEAAPVTGTVGAPTVVTPPAAVVDGWDVNFGTYASFNVKNTGGHARKVYAYTTSFDNQSAALASKVENVGAGQRFAYEFNAYCVQLDLSTEAVGGRPDVGFAIYDKLGKVITPANREEKIAECRRGTPTPSPSPTPTPQPSPSPSPTPDPERNPDPTPTPTPTPTPAPALCYYKIDGQGGEDAHQATCEATLGGNPLVLGVWINFDSTNHVLDNHCHYTVPGISLKGFNLTPGQSDPACLKKPTGNPNQ